MANSFSKILTNIGISLKERIQKEFNKCFEQKNDRQVNITPLKKVSRVVPNKQLIKSADRVRDFGEVFTPDFLVEKMLDQYPADAWEPNKNWLEPTCGNGQFIIGVLNRKLSTNIVSMKPFMCLMTALNTTFGTDIMKDNISECRIRIYEEVIIPYWRKHNVYGEQRSHQRWRVACVVINNIRHTKDALKEDYGKFQCFTNLDKNKQKKLADRVNSLLELIDSELSVVSNSNESQRLYKELSVLSRGHK
jgi:hypothetical protein